MIVSRTPLRVSFLGGGTDFPSYFNFNNGYVLGATINKYVYVSMLPLPEFAEERFRFTYRVTESVQNFENFRHPVVREVLRYKNWKSPINIGTMADLPGRSGLGSSSSFTVGLLRALNHFDSHNLLPAQLAMTAVKVEREILGEPGGWQDQFHAAIGGFKLYEFAHGAVTWDFLNFDPEFVEFISNSLVLVPMKNWRDSGSYAEMTSKRVASGSGSELALDLATLTRETAYKLTEKNSILKKYEILSSAMSRAWKIKKILADNSIDQLVLEKIEIGLSNGATAARLCGAGGTGFILFLVPPQNRGGFIESMSADAAFSAGITNLGSEIISIS